MDAVSEQHAGKRLVDAAHLLHALRCERDFVANRRAVTRNQLVDERGLQIVGACEVRNVPLERVIGERKAFIILAHQLCGEIVHVQRRTHLLTPLWSCDLGRA